MCISQPCEWDVGKAILLICWWRHPTYWTRSKQEQTKMAQHASDGPHTPHHPWNRPVTRPQRMPPCPQPRVTAFIVLPQDLQLLCESGRSKNVNEQALTGLLLTKTLSRLRELPGASLLSNDFTFTIPPMAWLCPLRLYLSQSVFRWWRVSWDV